MDWKTVLQRYGLGTLLALIFAYFLMTTVTSAIAGVADTLDQHVIDMKLEDQRNRFLLRQICVNVAKDEAQRAGCADAAR